MTRRPPDSRRGPTPAVASVPRPEAATAPPADPLEAECRAAYCFHRRLAYRRRTGLDGAYDPPAVYDGRPAVVTPDGVVLQAAVGSAWARMAARLRQLNADPWAYLAVAFGRLTGETPEPNQVFSADRLADWKLAQAAAEDGARTDHRVSADYLRLAVSEYRRRGLADADALRAGLATGTAGSPLYRYCVARAYAAGDPAGFGPAAAALEAAALVQYRAARAAYDRHWAGFLPFDIDQRAGGRPAGGRLL